jgi:hypothetical protein
LDQKNPYLLVQLRQFQHFLECLLISGTVRFETAERERIIPAFLVQIQQHLLLQIVSTISNRNRVVVAIETVNQRLDRRLLQMTNVRSCLTRLLIHCNSLRIDSAKSINNDLKKVKLSQECNFFENLTCELNKYMYQLTFPLTD